MRGLALIVVLAGCFKPSPVPGAPCSTSGDCPSGLECAPDNRCEKPGAFDVDAPPEPDACVTGICQGDMLVGCGATITCASGCSSNGVAHCLQLVPSNGITASLLSQAVTDMTGDKVELDAGDGSIRVMGTLIRLGGAGVNNGIRFQVINNIAVWTANSWAVPSASTWTFTGARPVALYAATTITIRSALLLNATESVGVFGGTSSNAGTAAGCQGRAGREIDANHAEGGGGGGGNASLGGNGGPSNQGGTFTGIGGSCASRPSTIPLVAGNGGGASGTALGGGGGGAVALVAMESITISSAVSVSGAGGAAGANGGAGGGGGGAILIESPIVTITGQLTANGGGGGAPGGGTIGNDGTTTSAIPAAGGQYTGTGGPTTGGAGAAGGTTAGTGTSYNVDIAILGNVNRGGGGGGAAGKIEVKRKIGGVAGISSPAATITDAMFE